MAVAAELHAENGEAKGNTSPVLEAAPVPVPVLVLVLVPVLALPVPRVPELIPAQVQGRESNSGAGVNAGNSSLVGEGVEEDHSLRMDLVDLIGLVRGGYGAVVVLVLDGGG